MNSLAEIIYLIIKAEMKREVEDALDALIETSDKQITGSAALDDVRLKRCELVEYFTEHKN